MAVAAPVVPSILFDYTISRRINLNCRFIGFHFKEHLALLHGFIVLHMPFGYDARAHIHIDFRQYNFSGR